MVNITFTSGMKLLKAKKYETVYSQSIEALRKDEKNPLPFFLLGVLSSDTGNRVKALELFSKASEHGHENVYYQIYYAKALGSLGHHDQAKKHADIAAGIGTNDALLADMIGVVYSRSGYHELAIPFFKKAAAKNPNWANFHFNLGASAEFIGDFGLAKKAYTKVLMINPKFYLAWFSLIALEKQTSSNNHLEKLTALFEGAARDTEARLLIGHSIAKTLEDLERYEESLDWLKKGKLAKQNKISYSSRNMVRVFEAAKSTIKINIDVEGESVSSAAPLFVVGMPRTGTTLVDRILSSHEQVRSGGELNLFPDLVKKARGTLPDMPIDAAALLGLTIINAADLGKNYINATKELTKGARHLVDKMPLNFFYVGLINRALPNAKIIALRRGGMDTCLSNYRQLFALHNHNYGYTLAIEDTAAFYREFDGLMEHWRNVISPDRFMEIAYEDIINDQETQTGKLLDFCELPWDEACMRFHENAEPVATASSVQVRRPLHSGSIGRWKKYGHKLDGLKAVLGKLAN